jgi:hypothetical protein
MERSCVVCAWGFGAMAARYLLATHATSIVLTINKYWPSRASAMKWFGE